MYNTDAHEKDESLFELGLYRNVHNCKCIFYFIQQ